MNPVQNEVLYDKYRVRRTLDVERICSNCNTRETNAWRKDPRGKLSCNPCGLYERNMGKPRPANLWKKTCQKRRKRTYSKTFYARILPVNMDIMIESTPSVRQPEPPTMNQSPLNDQEEQIPWFSPQEFLQQLIRNLDNNANFLTGQQSVQEPQPKSNLDRHASIPAPMMSSSTTRKLKPEGLTMSGTFSSEN